MNAKVLTASVLALTIALSGSAIGANAVPDLVPSGYTIANTDVLATRVLNSKVYSGTAAAAPEIGYVKDIVLGSSGQNSAVVLGIGGFLGAGVNDVAVAYPQIQWTVASDGSLRGAMNTTKDALAAAPDFKFPDVNVASITSSAAAQNASSVVASASTVSSSALPAAEVDVSKLKPLDVATIKAE